MRRPLNIKSTFAILIPAVIFLCNAAWGAALPEDVGDFPRRLKSYGDQDTPGIIAVVANRISEEPFNLVATLIFFCAIVHTFLSSKFT
jgi:hypothetical protein